ncbi:MAG: alpha/beta hydrolase family esterase [Myxococcota bacterium]
MIRWILPLLIAVGCKPKPDCCDFDDQNDDTGRAEGDSDSDDTGDEAAPLPLLNGLYTTGFLVGPVAGLIQPLQLEFTMSLGADGTRNMDTIILRAADEAGAVSDDLAMVNDVPVAEDGSFELTWELFTLPPEFSPTAGPVDISAVMTGSIRDAEFVCGEVTGEIISFGMDLAGSTFAGIPWEDRILGTPSACEAGGLEPVDRIESCPVIEAGRMLDFPSGGSDREVELHIPDSYVSGTPTPLVFVWHGIGSSIDGMLGSENLLEEANETGHIIVAPQALDRGGTAAWDPVGGPDYNLDVVLFDDLLTCMSEQYTIDPERVYATGMSLGGIFTGTLISSRSDVLASAAPFSGGLFRPKSDGWVAIPTVVSWGGEEDIYYDQDFDVLAGQMVDALGNDDHFVIQCNHGLGHSLSAELWDYTFQFFADHPRGVTPAPYAGVGLPDVFPDYCSIATGTE